MTLKEYDAIIEQSKKAIFDSLKQSTLTDDDVVNWLQYFKNILANYTGMEKIAGVFDRAESIVRNSIWIPVKERLPKEGGLYLVYTEEQPFVCPFEDGEFLIDDVLAWMPLPKSYKEKSND